MKKIIVLVASIFTFATTVFAQEKMNLLMKDGSVVSYNVDDILSFYFTGAGQNPQIVENCGIAINDELALTDKFALDLTYESEVEYVMIGVYTPENYNEAIGDDAIVEELGINGVRIDKSTTIVTAGNMPEGKNLTVVFTGFNNQGKHGPVYRHQIQTHVEADQPKAVVTSCFFNSSAFLYTIEMDDKAQSFYLFEDISNNVELMQTAAFGMLWRQAIAANPTKGLYSTGTTITKQRPNGETQLYVATWALGQNSQYSGYIFEGLYDVSASGVMRRAYSLSNRGIEAYNKEECLKIIKDMNRIVP